MNTHYERRLRWACRRGLLELDVVLSRFWEREFAQLDNAARGLFEELLSYADNDLWYLIATPDAAVGEQHIDIIKKLREV